MLSLPDEIQFRDPVRARPEIADMQKLPAPALRVVKALLPSLPNPDDSVHFLHRLMDEAPDGARKIVANFTALRYALTIFSYSRFLADAVIRYPEWLLDIAEAAICTAAFSGKSTSRCSPPNSPPMACLARWTSLSSAAARFSASLFATPSGSPIVSETAEDLSNLADAILNVAWRAVRARLSHAGGAPAGAFSVIALGKLGGRELNYSSDIDLMFIFDGDDATQPPDGSGATPKEFFNRAANRMTELLSTYTPEGMCYRVDLRLRPDGSLGEVCQSLEGAQAYYATRGRDWELQMLIKARVAAGDPEPGPRTSGFRRAADLQDHHRFPDH